MYCSSLNIRLVGEMQSSVVDEYCFDPWATEVAGKKIFVSKHWHYRVVLSTVGYGISRLEGTAELLHATLDVFHGAHLTSSPLLTISSCLM